MHSFRQTGSVASYIIIGVLLIAVLVGGVFAIRHFLTGNQSSQSTPAPEPTPVKTSTPAQPAAPDSQQNQAQAPPPEASSRQQANTPAPSSTIPQTGPSALPHTGPVESITAAFMGAILGGFAVAYLRSERERQSL